MRGPQVRVIGHGRVAGVQALRRGIEEFVAFAGDAGDDFGGDAAPRPRFAHAEQTAGARDAGDDGVRIQGFDGAQIHDFNLPAFGGEFVRGGDAFVHHGAIGDNGEVATFAGDAGLAHGQGGVRQFVGLEMVIQELVFAENHRVINGHGFEQHAVGVFDRGGGEDDQAGIMRVNRLHHLAVKGPAAGGAAAGQAHGDGAGDIRAPEKRGRLVHDLVETDGGEIRKLHFDDRAQAFDGGADGEAHHGVFADGGIQHATGKFFGEIFSGFEGAAERADILAVDEHAGIILQRARLRLPDGFQIGDAHDR